MTTNPNAMGARPRHRRFLLLSALIVLLAPAASNVRAGETLVEKLDKALGDPALRGARIGARVIRVPDGKVLFERDAKAPLIPASNMKLVTLTHAIAELGAAFQHRTSAVSRDRPVDGVVKGDLLLVGGGDPNLSGRYYGGRAQAPFDLLAAQVFKAGVRRVSGRVVGVDALFDPRVVHPDWPRDQLDKWYEAPVAALSANDNCLDVTVKPGARAGDKARVVVAPLGWAGSVESSCVTTGNRREHVIRVRREGDRVIVGGKVWTGSRGYTANVTVGEPVLLAAEVFRAALIRAGVDVRGPAAASREPISGAVRTLAVLRNPLVKTLRATGRNSQNFYAESLFQYLAARKKAPATWESAAKEARAFLKSASIKTGGLALRDGSGMSRKNRLSAEAITSLLLHAAKSEDLRGPLLDALALSGTRGTLSRRLRGPGVKGRVAGKTGTLRGVSALSGFILVEGRPRMAFSLLMNGDGMSTSAARTAQDRVARLLCEETGK